MRTVESIRGKRLIPVRDCGNHGGGGGTDDIWEPARFPSIGQRGATAGALPCRLARERPSTPGRFDSFAPTRVSSVAPTRIKLAPTSDSPIALTSFAQINGRTSAAACHLRHSLFHFPLADVLDVGHDRPLVAEGILESRIAITVELIGGFLHRAGASAQRL